MNVVDSNPTEANPGNLKPGNWLGNHWQIVVPLVLTILGLLSWTWICDRFAERPDFEIDSESLQILSKANGSLPYVVLQLMVKSRSSVDHSLKLDSIRFDKLDLTYRATLSEEPRIIGARSLNDVRFIQKDLFFDTILATPFAEHNAFFTVYLSSSYQNYKVEIKPDDLQKCIFLQTPTLLTNEAQSNCCSYMLPYYVDDTLRLSRFFVAMQSSPYIRRAVRGLDVVNSCDTFSMYSNRLNNRVTPAFTGRTRIPMFIPEYELMFRQRFGGLFIQNKSGLLPPFPLPTARDVFGGLSEREVSTRVQSSMVFPFDSLENFVVFQGGHVNASHKVRDEEMGTMQYVITADTSDTAAIHLAAFLSRAGLRTRLVKDCGFMLVYLAHTYTSLEAQRILFDSLDSWVLRANEAVKTGGYYAFEFTAIAEHIISLCDSVMNGMIGKRTEVIRINLRTVPDLIGDYLYGRPARLTIVPLSRADTVQIIKTDSNREYVIPNGLERLHILLTKIVTTPNDSLKFVP